MPTNLHELVGNSYQLLSPSSDPKSLHQLVLSVKKAYRDLERSQNSRREMVETKFMLQKWRQDIAEFLHENLITRSGTCTEVHLDSLRNLEFHLQDDYLKSIAAAVERSTPSDSLQKAFQELLVQQNRVHLFQAPVQAQTPKPIAGPRLRLPIRPILPSKWPHQRWLKNSEFSRYTFHGEEVHYRGLKFLPGDLLITNMNLDSAGVYTLPCEPESFGAHIGIYVLLKRGDQVFPTVLEIFRTGLRALPLSAYLDHEFCAYVEVYRPKNTDPTIRERLNQAAEPLIDEIEGYQYYTDQGSTTHANCTDIASRLYETAGLGSFEMKTSYTHPIILENMGRLGFHCRKVLSPIDFITTGELTLEGVVDNGHFNRELPRYMAGQTMIQIFRNSPLEIRSLHSFFHLEVWAIKHIQRGNLLGKIIAFFNGFTVRNFPKGPPSLISFVEYLHRELSRLTSRLEKPVHAALHETSGSTKQPFLLYQFQENRSVRDAMQKNSTTLARYFQSRYEFCGQPESQ